MSAPDGEGAWLERFAAVRQIRKGRRPELFAAAWGCLLPIDRLLEIPEAALNLPRYGIAVVLALMVPATLTGVARRRLGRLYVLLLALGLVRIVMGQYHGDSAGRMIGFVLVASVATCGPLAWRPRLHRSILTGYLLGVSLSGVVCLMQAIDVQTLRPPGPGLGRYPGLGSTTMSFTWQVVFACMVAVYLLATEPRRSARWCLGLVGLPVCAAALLVSGAQGGLLGVVAGSLAFLLFADPAVRARVLSPRAIAVLVGILGFFAAVFALTDLHASTFGDWVGGDFGNERARADIARVGWSTFLDHPLLGVGRQQFFSEHVIAPHFLPLESAVSAGALAGLLAAAVVLVTWGYLVAGPARGPYALLGAVMLAAMCANTLTETSGPYIGVGRLILLSIALVATSGADDVRQEAEGSDTPPSAVLAT